MLREETGCSLFEAKYALEKADWDMLLAKGILKYKGLAIHIKNMTREEWVMERALEYVNELKKNKNLN